MDNTTRIHQEVVLQALSSVGRGLAKYTAGGKLALIMSARQMTSGDRENAADLLLIDPLGLLEPQKAALATHYLSSGSWERKVALGLPGVVCHEHPAGAIAYQVWIAERHPQILNYGPIKQWLGQAAQQLNHEYSSDEAAGTTPDSIFPGLEEYAPVGIAKYLSIAAKQQLAGPPRLRFANIIDALPALSVQLEEGARPSGAVYFLPEHRLTEIEFLAYFNTQSLPTLRDYKHVGKLLTVSASAGRALVSDGIYLYGVCNIGTPLPGTMYALFKNGRIDLFSGTDQLCTIVNGRFSGLSFIPSMVNLDKALADLGQAADRSTLFQEMVQKLVIGAQAKRHGCTIVLDFTDTPLTISGQILKDPLPIADDNLSLVQSMTKVDGALHINSAAQLLGFACLLDGTSSPHEVRARGTRYNSALRYSLAYPDRIIVIVVSEDGPITVFHGGQEVGHREANWDTALSAEVPTLAEWAAA